MKNLKIGMKFAKNRNIIVLHFKVKVNTLKQRGLYGK